MEDFTIDSSQSLNESFIENNFQIEQIEDDFENAFNKIFKKDEPIIEEHDELNEMENKIYYIQNTNNFTQKEESIQISQIWNSFELMKKKSSNDDDCNEIKLTGQKIPSTENGKKEHKNIEINISQNEVKEINIEEELKNELCANSSNEAIKNKFRTYSSIDFNLFHPGGTVDYFKYIREEMKHDALKQKKEEKKVPKIPPKFNILNENNKKIRKKAKEKRKRKEKPDDVRKKIKARFLKLVKNRINEKLKSVKSKEFFDFLPQSFVSNISKKTNQVIIDLTFKELMSKKFFEESNPTDNIKIVMLQKKRNPDKKKYENNKKVLKYLEKNINISKNSNFDVIGNLTFREMFNEYLKSEEFENEILKLKSEDNSEKYIKDYINKAYNFIDYFSREI